MGSTEAEGAADFDPMGSTEAEGAADFDPMGSTGEWPGFAARGEIPVVWSGQGCAASCAAVAEPGMAWRSVAGRGADAGNGNPARREAGKLPSSVDWATSREWETTGPTAPRSIGSLGATLVAAADSAGSIALPAAGAADSEAMPAELGGGLSRAISIAGGSAGTGAARLLALA